MNTVLSRVAPLMALSPTGSGPTLIMIIIIIFILTIPVVYNPLAPPPATVPLGRSLLWSGKRSYNHHLHPAASNYSNLQSPKAPTKHFEALSEGTFKSVIFILACHLVDIQHIHDLDALSSCLEASPPAPWGCIYWLTSVIGNHQWWWQIVSSHLVWHMHPWAKHEYQRKEDWEKDEMHSH